MSRLTIKRVQAVEEGHKGNVSLAGRPVPVTKFYTKQPDGTQVNTLIPTPYKTPYEASHYPAPIKPA